MLMPRLFKNTFFDDDPRFPFVFPSQVDNPIMKTDVKDMEDHFELDIELPGYTKENVKAELKDKILIITAETTKEKEERDQKGNFIRRERYSGSCKRSFFVGDGVKEEDIKAEFKDGILHVNIAKKDAPAIEEKKYIAIE